MAKKKIKEIEDEEFKQFRRQPGVFGLWGCVVILKDKVNEMIRVLNEMKKEK